MFKPYGSTYKGRQEYSRKQPGREAFKKFDAPKTPLEREKKIKNIEPLPAHRDKFLRRHCKEQIRDARFELNKITKNDFGADADRAALEAKIRAAELTIQHIDEAKFRETAGQRFLVDFWKWLLGRGEQGDVDRTPWGRAPMTDDKEVASYIDLLVGRRQEALMEIQLLSQRVPIGINEVYLFYKYVVKGMSVSTEEFLVDFDRFESLRDPQKALRDPNDKKANEPVDSFYEKSKTDARAHPEHPQYPNFPDNPPRSKPMDVEGDDESPTPANMAEMEAQDLVERGIQDPQPMEAKTEAAEIDEEEQARADAEERQRLEDLEKARKEVEAEEKRVKKIRQESVKGQEEDVESKAQEKMKLAKDVMTPEQIQEAKEQEERETPQPMEEGEDEPTPETKAEVEANIRAAAAEKALEKERKAVAKAQAKMREQELATAELRGEMNALKAILAPERHRKPRIEVLDEYQDPDIQQRAEDARARAQAQRDFEEMLAKAKSKAPPPPPPRIQVIDEDEGRAMMELERDPEFLGLRERKNKPVATGRADKVVKGTRPEEIAAEAEEQARKEAAFDERGREIAQKAREAELLREQAISEKAMASAALQRALFAQAVRLEQEVEQARAQNAADIRVEAARQAARAEMEAEFAKLREELEHQPAQKEQSAKAQRKTRLENDPTLSSFAEKKRQRQRARMARTISAQAAEALRIAKEGEARMDEQLAEQYKEALTAEESAKAQAAYREHAKAKQRKNELRAIEDILRAGIEGDIDDETVTTAAKALLDASKRKALIEPMEPAEKRPVTAKVLRKIKRGTVPMRAPPVVGEKRPPREAPSEEHFKGQDVATGAAAAREVAKVTGEQAEAIAKDPRGNVIADLNEWLVMAKDKEEDDPSWIPDEARLHLASVSGGQFANDPEALEIIAEIEKAVARRAGGGKKKKK